MVQLITKDEKTIINISGEIVSVTDKNIVMLIDSSYLTEKEKSLLETTDGFFVSVHHEQELIATKNQFIKTSIRNNGSSTALQNEQWLIDFEI